MKAVIQRVKSASVTIDNAVTGECANGFAVFLGVEKGDSAEDCLLLADKISKLRIFEDDAGKMNFSLADIEGEMLIISNFTLCADCSHGNRPDFFGAEEPRLAKELYEHFVALMKTRVGGRVDCGVFGADMKVSILNDGPVTIILDSRILKKPMGNNR